MRRQIVLLVLTAVAGCTTTPAGDPGVIPAPKAGQVDKLVAEKRRAGFRQQNHWPSGPCSSRNTHGPPNGGSAAGPPRLRTTPMSKILRFLKQHRQEIYRWNRLLVRAGLPVIDRQARNKAKAAAN